MSPIYSQFLTTATETPHMCCLESVFHKPCRHWGRDQFSGEPCCRSRIVDGRPTGCAYVEVTGSVNSNDICSNCKYRDATSQATGVLRPFSLVSDEGWAKVEEVFHQRSILGGKGRNFPSRHKAYHPTEKCR